MLELVSQNYWWSQMSRYIGQYMSTCDLCLCMEPSRKPLVGELHSIPVPDAWWDTLSIDFMVELFKSSGYGAIITVVDSVSKRAHFILMHMMVTTEGVARLFLYQVWKLYRLPRLLWVVSATKNITSILTTYQQYQVIKWPWSINSVGRLCKTWSGDCRTFWKVRWPWEH